ncbi:DUF5667 domain-containing protein [Alteromonas gracilis]
MSIDFLERRRAEDFHRALEDPSGAEVDSSLAPLLVLARSLAKVQAPQPRAEVTADLRARLMAEAATALAAPDDRLVLAPRTAGTRRRHRLASAVAAAALVAVPAGVAAASQQALPGDALYSVKRGLEAAGERVSLSDAGRGQDLLGQASSRLDELGALGPQADPLTVERGLAEFGQATTRGAELLLAAYASEEDPATAGAVRDFARAEMPRLEALTADADPTLLSRFAEAAGLLAALDEQARAACSACSGAPVQMPAMLADGIAFASARTTLTELLVDDPAQALARVTAPRATPSDSAEDAPADPAPDAPLGTPGGVADGSQVVVDDALARTVRDLLSGELLRAPSGGTTTGGATSGAGSTPTNQFDPANVLGTVTTTAGSTTRAVGEILGGTTGLVGDTVGGVGGVLDDTVRGTVGGLLP